MKRWLFAMPILSLSACCSTPAIQAIDVSLISKVQDNVSHQVGQYLIASALHPTILARQPKNDGSGDTELVQAGIETLTVPPDDPNRNVFACGSGNLNLDISSIKLELTTGATNTYGLTASATAPTVDLFTLSGKTGYTWTNAYTQSLKYEIWPLDPIEQTNLKDAKLDGDLRKDPIAFTLKSLRQSLIGSATRYDYMQYPPQPRPPKPCFTDYNPLKPLEAPNNIYTFGVTFAKEGSAGVTVALTALSLGANGDWKSSNGNTLTVGFQQPGLQELAAAANAVADACKKSSTSKDCHDMSARQKQVTDKLGGLGHLGVLNFKTNGLYNFIPRSLLPLPGIGLSPAQPAQPTQ